MQEKIESESLQNITVHNGEFVWIKMHKEVLINGKMFDIKTYQTKADETVFIGLFDNDEKKIIDDINILVNNKNKPSIIIVKLFKILLAPNIVDEGNCCLRNPSENFKKVYFIYNEAAVSQIVSKYIPPPNL